MHLSKKLSKSKYKDMPKTNLTYIVVHARLLFFFTSDKLVWHKKLILEHGSKIRPSFIFMSQPDKSNNYCFQAGALIICVSSFMLKLKLSLNTLLIKICILKICSANSH